MTKNEMAAENLREQITKLSPEAQDRVLCFVQGALMAEAACVGERPGGAAGSA